MAPKSTIVDGSKPCTKCNNTKLVSAFYTTGKTINGEYKYNSWCKECVKEKAATYHKKTWGTEKLQFTAFKRTQSTRSYLTYLLGKARQRKECNITVAYLENLWLSQNGKCALTGWDMTMVLGSGNIATNASIDRINSQNGYEDGNVQLVCRAANVAKSNLTEQEFVNLCLAVGRNKNGL